MPWPFSVSLLKKPRVQFSSPLLGPEAMYDSRASNPGTHDVNRRNSTAYSSAVKSPPQPQLSLPTPQKRTFSGSGEPSFARRSASDVLPAGEFADSTHWEKERARRLRGVAAKH